MFLSRDQYRDLLPGIVILIKIFEVQIFLLLVKLFSL